MTLIRLWLGWQLRRRWRSLAVLTLLVAVSSGVMLTAVAGARRGESTLARLAEDTLPATALVLPGSTSPDWSTVRRLPQVEALSLVTEAGISFDGIAEQEELFVLPADTGLLRTIERPVVLAGRLPNPAASGEAVVTSRFVDAHGKGIGARVSTVLSVQDPQVRTALPELTIVGVVRSPMLSDDTASHGQLVLTPAFMARYRAAARAAGEDAFLGAAVRLKGGPAALRTFRQDLSRVTGLADIEVQDTTERVRRLQRVNAFEARFLFVFAIAVALTAMVLVGQAVARQVTAEVAELHALRALGAAPSQVTQLAVAAPFVAGCCGSALAILAAALASRWFPIGSAGQFEPRPGVLPDLPVLAIGGLAVPVLVLAGAAGAAYVAGWAGGSARPAGSAAGSGRTAGRSSVVTALIRMGAPVPVLVGARFALESRRGFIGGSARPALLGAVVGVLGVVAALTFATGIADAAQNPRRFGQVFDVGAELADGGPDFAPAAPVLAAAAADPGVAAVADLHWSLATVSGSNQILNVLSLEPVREAPDVVVTVGRLPRSASEILLGPESADALGVGSGERVRLRAVPGDTPMTVTGLGFVVESWRNSHASGAWVTGAGFKALFGSQSPGFAHLALVQVREGASAKDVAARLNRAPAVTAASGAIDFQIAPAPLRLGEIRQVRTLPTLLGGFLALLASGAVGHALATSVRRRSRELAVLRALGLTTNQTRAAVWTQACVLALVGLAFGAPLGLALGRILWRAVADYTPLQYVPPLPGPALLLAVPLALLAASLLAAIPSDRAARLRVAAVLRAE